MKILSGWLIYSGIFFDLVILLKSLNDIKKEKELKVQLDIFDSKDYKGEEKLRKLSKKLKSKFGDNIITNFEELNSKKKKTIITTSFSKDFLD